MKTKFLTMFILFISLGFNSCSPEEEIQINKEATNLTDQLIKFNDEYQSTSNQKCDGFLDCVGSVAAIASGDVIGAWATMEAASGIAAAAGVATGGTGAIAVEVGAGILGAAGGSYLTYREIESTKSLQFNNTGYLINLEHNNDFLYSDNFGNFHNDMLENHYFGNTSANDWIIENITEVNSNEIQDVLNSQAWADYFIQLEETTAVYKNSDFDIFKVLDYYYAEDLMTEKTYTFLNLFFEEYLESKTFEDIENVVQFYLTAVENTNELSKEEKKPIIFALDTAAKSPYFWIKKL